MYQDELRREAEPIMRSRQAWVRDLANFWAWLVARLNTGTAKSAQKGLRLH